MALDSEVKVFPSPLRVHEDCGLRIQVSSEAGGCQDSTDLPSDMDSAALVLRSNGLCAMANGRQ
jgi:hypothetical protein